MNAFGASTCVLCHTKAPGLRTIPAPTPGGPSISHHLGADWEKCLSAIEIEGLTADQYEARTEALFDRLARSNPSAESEWTKMYYTTHSAGGTESEGVQTLLPILVMTDAMLRIKQGNPARSA